MAPRSEALKQDLLEKIHGLIEKRQSGDKAVCARNFVDHYYRYAPVHDMLGVEIEDLYGAAISLWNFGQECGPAEAKIRVYNPRFEEHGWHSTHTVIEIVNDDMPFLVDSVTMDLARQNTTVHLVIHPVFGVARDDSGAAIDFPLAPKRPKDLPNESFMHVEIDEQTSADALAEIEAGLRLVLADVRASVEDWRPMRAQAQSIAKDLKSAPPAHLDAATVAEMVAFVQWLHDDHFTFMGYREVAYKGSGKSARLQIVDQTGLGVLRDPDREVFEGLRDLGRAIRGAVTNDNHFNIGHV